MAVTTQKGDQVTNLDATPPVVENTANMHGRMRIAYFSHTQSGAGDANSTVEVVRLPAGKVRLLGALSRIEHNWTVSTVDMNVGWAAYVDIDGTAVVADPNGLDAAIDVDSAGTIAVGSVLGTADTKLFESQSGVSIELQAVAAGLADTDTVEGYLVYVVD